MSEWLTTGQMIDRLKIGQRAVGLEGFYEGAVVKVTGHGEVIFEKNNELFRVNTFAKDAKWQIVPRYISFEDALLEIKTNKKVIYFHPENVEPIAHSNRSMVALDNTPFGRYTLNELINGKWSVVE